MSQRQAVEAEFEAANEADRWGEAKQIKARLDALPKTVDEMRRREAEEQREHRQEVDTSQAAILDEFFAATGGAGGGCFLCGGGGWKEKEGWMETSSSCADRCGVTVDGEGFVTAVALPNNGLRGEIPASFGGLGKLVSVDLRGNAKLVHGAAALKAAGLSAKAVKEGAEFSAKEMRAAGWSAAELTTAGLGPTDFATAFGIRPDARKVYDSANSGKVDELRIYLAAGTKPDGHKVSQAASQ